MKAKVIYMATTKDKYELPIAIAPSVKELSEKVNVPAGTIHTYISKKLGRFYKIILDEE